MLYDMLWYPMTNGMICYATMYVEKDVLELSVLKTLIKSQGLTQRLFETNKYVLIKL